MQRFLSTTKLTGHALWLCFLLPECHREVASMFLDPEMIEIIYLGTNKMTQQIKALPVKFDHQW